MQDDEDENDQFLELWNVYPVIDTSSTKTLYDEIESYNAMMSCHMHIPFPELLDDETWIRKARQLEWLMENNHLPVKLNNGKKDSN